jgi:hypothetical protein
MTVQILSQAMKEKVRKDDRLLLTLAEANEGVKVDTIKRWLRENNVILTTATNLQIIRGYFGLSDLEVLTEEKGEVVVDGEQI